MILEGDSALTREGMVTESHHPTPSEGAGPLLGVLVARAPRAGVPERSSIRRTSIIIGRGEGAGLRLDAASVGSPHAELSLQSGVWFLRSLDRTTGTWVDGEPVTEPAPVAPGSTLRLGEIELILVPHDRWEHSAVNPDLASEPAITREPQLPAASRAAFTLDAAQGQGSSMGNWLTVALVAGLVLIAYLIWGR